MLIQEEPCGPHQDVSRAAGWGPLLYSHVDCSWSDRSLRLEGKNMASKYDAQ